MVARENGTPNYVGAGAAGDLRTLVGECPRYCQDMQSAPSAQDLDVSGVLAIDNGNGFFLQREISSNFIGHDRVSSGVVMPWHAKGEKT